MSVDGLSHVYKITKDEAVKELLDEMIDVYLSIDKIGLRVQTHCTLTAARGMMRMFSVTGEEKYQKGAEQIYDLYVNGGGMTYTYQNLNWWNRHDSWTEPCAVVDKKMPYVETAMFYMLNDYHGYSVSTSEDNFGLFTSFGDPEKPCCPKPAALELYKYIHKTEDVSPLYKYCPELMPK